MNLDNLFKNFCKKNNLEINSYQLSIIEELKNYYNLNFNKSILNKFFSNIMVMLIELLPFKIITRDNLKSMELDNVTDINDAYLFKSHFLSLPSYLRK